MPHRRRTGCVISVLASQIQTWSHMASASRARRYCSESSRIVVAFEIVQLEAQIAELAARIESCRKFILAGRIAVAGGGVVLIAGLVGAIQFDPSVIAVAVAAVRGGIVAAGPHPHTGSEGKP